MRARWMTLFFLTLVLITSTASTSWAVSTLHIGFGDGTACATGCAGDPNVSGGPALSAEFDIYQTSGGVGTAIQPVLMIIGVPDVTDPNFFSASSITDLTSINPYPGGTSVGSPPNTWTYGTTAFGLNGSGYQGNFTSGEVYSNILHLSGANLSNNFGNWHDADLTINGIDATGFGIYVFGLNADLGAQGLLNVTFADETTVPLGSYIIGYAAVESTDNHGRLRVTYYSTPFTESGLQCCTEVPEPSSLLLLGSGLVGLFLWGRKRDYLVK